MYFIFSDFKNISFHYLYSVRLHATEPTKGFTSICYSYNGKILGYFAPTTAVCASRHFTSPGGFISGITSTRSIRSQLCNGVAHFVETNNTTTQSDIADSIKGSGGRR